MSDARPASWFARRLPEAGPPRTLAVATFVNTMGTGLLLTSSVLYFTRVVHLSAARVGLGLAVAGVLSLLAGVLAGDLADRRGPRGLYIGTLVVQAATTLGMLLVRDFAMFLIVVCLDLVAQTTATTVRIPLIRRLAGEGATAYRSRLRAITNAGIAIGAACAGIAIQADTRAAYSVLIVADAATFLICALISLRLPGYQPLPKPKGERRWVVFADRPFVAVTALNGLMSFQYAVLTLALPIWIVSHTHAPRWAASSVLLINAVLCTLLQVRVGRTIDNVHRSGLALRKAGLLFLISLPLMALASGVPGWVAVGLVVVAVIVHSIAELWHASASFALGFELAPAHVQGQYQGVFSLGIGASQALAPAPLTLLCITWGRPGWFVLGGIFALTGLAAPAVTGWAERTRGSLLPAPVPAAA